MRHKVLLQVEFLGSKTEKMYQKRKLMSTFRRVKISDNIVAVYTTHTTGMMCYRNGIAYGFNTERKEIDTFGTIVHDETVYYLHKAGYLNSTSQYTYIYLRGTSMDCARHQLIALAFGLWDGETDFTKEVCHRISKKAGGSDGVDNLFIDTHEFNTMCNRLERRLNRFGVEQPAIDRKSYQMYLAAANLLEKKEAIGMGCGLNEMLCMHNNMAIALALMENPDGSKEEIEERKKVFLPAIEMVTIDYEERYKKYKAAGKAGLPRFELDDIHPNTGEAKVAAMYWAQAGGLEVPFLFKSERDIPAYELLQQVMMDMSR